MKYFLHFIGSKIYTINILEREAKHKDIQRTVTFYTLKRLKFGDPILLAHYTTKNNKKKTGTAETFGYLTLTGITHNLPDNITKKLNKQLDIIKITQPTNPTVARACGSYTIGSIATIKNTLQQLYEKISKLLEEENLKPNTFKWFITGQYTPLTPFIIQPITFTRGIKEVDIDNLNLKTQKQESANIIWIYNYKQRKYMSNLMKERLESKSDQLDKYFRR